MHCNEPSNSLWLLRQEGNFDKSFKNNWLQLYSLLRRVSYNRWPKKVALWCLSTQIKYSKVYLWYTKVYIFVRLLRTCDEFFTPFEKWKCLYILMGRTGLCQIVHFDISGHYYNYCSDWLCDYGERASEVKIFNECLMIMDDVKE